jgi:hypothetical protein
MSLTEWVIALLVVVAALVLFIAGQGIYCHFFPSYQEYDTCFDFDYRCQAECRDYGLIYQNMSNPENTCQCDCGSAYVSMCSGFRYPKVNKSEILYKFE